MNVLFVGQAPGRKSGPPLSGRAGAVLAALAGLPQDEFERIFPRTNLLRRFPGKRGKGDAFPTEVAGRAARTLLRRLPLNARLVLLGAGVARAFGLRARPLEVLDLGRRGAVALLVPHPSGVNLWWNRPENRTAAAEALRAFLREAGAEVRDGADEPVPDRDGRSKAEKLDGLGDVRAAAARIVARQR